MQIEASTVEIEERGVKLRLTVVDTPGYGDAINCRDWYVHRECILICLWRLTQTSYLSWGVEVWRVSVKCWIWGGIFCFLILRKLNFSIWINSDTCKEASITSTQLEINFVALFFILLTFILLERALSEQWPWLSIILWESKSPTLQCKQKSTPRSCHIHLSIRKILCLIFKCFSSS